MNNVIHPSDGLFKGMVYHCGAPEIVPGRNGDVYWAPDAQDYSCVRSGLGTVVPARATAYALAAFDLGDGY